jgi:uncharacterized protein (TIGR03067 family)
MKNFCCLVIILLSAGLIIHGCGGSEDSAKTDQELMQGTWAGTAAGMDMEFKMTISGNNFNMESTDSTLWYKGTFVLDEKVTPKQADFKINECNIEQYIGTTAKGIYKIENDTWTFAGNEPGSDIRPTDFVASEETQVFTLKKQ